MATPGLGRAVTSHCRSSTLYQIREHIRCLCFRSYLNRQCDRTLGDPATWGDERWPRGGSGAPGEPPLTILHRYGVAQSAPMWFVRGVPAVRAAFAQIYGTDSHGRCRAIQTPLRAPKGY